MASPDQPQAPYLNAVVAYGFRGSTRFHVPGHKAGNGADLGVRTAIGWQALKLDIPQDIHGVDLGESPTPFERAEQLAAEAYGAARSWFLTNGATQGNHALCLALAPLGAPVVVQRNAHASVIDGLVLSGGLPTWVAPQYEPELGMAHGVTPESLAAGAARHAGRARGVHRLPHLLRDGGRRRGLRRGRARRRRAADRRPVLGSALRLPPRAAAERAARRRGRDADLGAQDRGVSDAERAAARVGLGARGPRRRRAHAAAVAHHLAVVAADAVAGRRAAPARAARRGAADTRSPPRGGPPRRSIRSPAAASSATRRSAGPASPRATRCGS